MSSITNKTAIVTGASSGLGYAVTQELSKEGVKVLAISRNVDSIDFSKSVIKISADITDSNQIAEAFKVIDDEVQQIDILVNCAGRGLVKNLEESSLEEIDAVLDLNLKRNIMIAYEVYKRMISYESGHIINVISTSGIKARVDETIYCASKWGLRGFTESLRMAAAPHKIRVTSVIPGGMQTNFWKGGEPRDTSKFMTPDDIATEIIHILKTPTSIAPSEYVIERGF